MDDQRGELLTRKGSTMKLLDRAARLFGRSRKTLSENAVAHSRIDSVVLGDWRKRAPMLEGALSEQPEAAGPGAGDGGPLASKLWERLGEDVFYSYFGQQEPHVHTRDEMSETFWLNRDVVEKHHRDDGFADQRARTRSKAFEASLATIGALASLRESYESELYEFSSRQNDMAREEASIDDLIEQMGKLRERRAEAAQSDVGAIDEQMRELAKQRRQAGARLDGLHAEQRDRIGDMREAVNGAVAKAAQAAQEAVETAELIDGIGKGAGGGARLTAQQMFELADRIKSNPALQRMLELMGAIELSMSSTRRKRRRGGYEELDETELGADLAVVLPQEKMLMLHPLGKREFFRRFTENALMQYSFTSESELKKGPIIIVCDGSASMSGARIYFAKAFGLACVQIGNREDRNVLIVDVGGPGQSRSFLFRKHERINAVDALEYAEFFFNSGTDLETGLHVAKEQIDTEAPFHTADVILLSDGQDRLSDSVLALRDEFRAQAIRIHGIAIGMQPTEYLTTVCEHVEPLDDRFLRGANNATDRIAIDLT